MAKKLYDLAVKTGEYTNQQGETKGRWQNVGAVMQNDDGKFIMLERWFNPAGVPNPDNRSNLLLSMFEPKPAGDGQTQHQQQKQNGYAPQPGADDEHPF